MAEIRKLDHDWFDRPLPGGVEIGAGSWLYSSYAFLHCHSRRPSPVRIGINSGIYNGSFFELGISGEVDVGNFCAIVGAIFRTNQRIIIEDYAFIAHEVVLADDFADMPPRPLLNDKENVWDPPLISIAIRRNAWIGARAILLKGADIGEGAIVGAAAVIDFPVSPFAIVAGNPAKIVGWTQKNAT